MRASLERWTRILCYTYYVILITKLSVVCLLQLAYIEATSKLKVTGNRSKQRWTRLIHTVEQMMQFTGNNHRALAATGLILYASYVLLPVIFHTFNWVYAQKLRRANNDGFPLFMRDERAGLLYTWRLIEANTHRVIHSNVNYTTRMLDRIRNACDKHSICVPSAQIALLSLEYRRRSICSRRSMSAEHYYDHYAVRCGCLDREQKYVPKRHQRLIKKTSSCARLDHEDQEELLQMRTQLAELNRLLQLGRNSPLWPENRSPCSACHKRAMQRHANICKLAFGVTATFGPILTYAGHLMAMRAQGQSSLLRMSWPDLLLMADQYVYIAIAAIVFLRPNLLLLHCFIDQVESLWSLQARLNKFNAMCLRYTHLAQADQCDSQHVYVRDLWQRHRRASLRRLQRECDRAALDLYICLQVFAHSQLNTIAQAQINVERSTLMVLTPLVLTMLIAIRYAITEQEHLWYLAISTWLALNWMYVMCAMYGAACMRFVRGTWKIVTKSVRDPKYDMCCISVHTSMLWRNLLGDCEASLRDKFACHLFGLMRLDYNGVLRFNAGVVLLSLLFVSQVLQQN